ncbi:MAG: DUF58 domain-containing protein [Myxococcales bacterium]|nr:DUF58 domain-containing protein [Myxococcales bacterium]
MRRGLKRVLGPIGSALDRAWQLVPVSVAGLVTGGVAWYCYRRYGQEQSDFVLQTATLVALAVVAVSVLCVGLAALRVFLAVRAPAARLLEADVDAGAELRTDFSFPSLWLWPMAQVEMRWARPTDASIALVAERGRWHERVTPQARGRYTAIVREFTIRDIFGLATVRFTRRAPAHLRVSPAPTYSEIVLAVRHASGEGYAHPAGHEEGDRVEMRRYAPGDPLRMILWKVYARSRRLLVRVPERAIAPKPSSVACFVAGADDEPTASAARMFIENGLLGADFTFVADGEGPPAHTADEAIERVIESADHRDQSGERLLSLPREHARAELTNCVIFVPGRPGPWLARLEALVPELPQPPTLVLAVDGALEAAGPGRVGRFLLRSAQDAGTLRGLPDLHARLAALGGPVFVVHRPTGQALDAVRIDALRAAA